jgi:hypothetical protein
MLSRALSLATVTLLIGCFAAGQAPAQNLEAGKSPAQIFAGTCNACHKSPRGLLKTVPAGSLPGFLRQHYTTSGEMASLLSAFLVSNGAADTRFSGNQPKPAKDAKPEGRPGGSPDQLDRFGRKLHSGAPSQEAARPEGEPGEAAKPAQAALERGPDGRKLSAKQRLSKRGSPGAGEPPKTEAAKDEAAKEEATKGVAAKEETPKGETAKIEDDKSEAAKPSGEGKSGTDKSESAKAESAKAESAKSESTKSESAKSESAKSEPSKPESATPESAKSESARIEPSKETGGETPVLRPDPVPPVTPAPATPPAVSAAIGSGTPPEPAAVPPVAAPQPAPPPAVTASVPPLPPVAPAGPPAPPISQ